MRHLRLTVLLRKEGYTSVPAQWTDRAIRGEAPLGYGLEDALLNMRILDALLRSEASAAWERV